MVYIAQHLWYIPIHLIGHLTPMRPLLHFGGTRYRGCVPVCLHTCSVGSRDRSPYDDVMGFSALGARSDCAITCPPVLGAAGPVCTCGPLCSARCRAQQAGHTRCICMRLGGMTAPSSVALGQALEVSPYFCLSGCHIPTDGESA